MTEAENVTGAEQAAEAEKRPKIRIIAKPAVTPDAPVDSMWELIGGRMPVTAGYITCATPSTLSNCRRSTMPKSGRISTVPRTPWLIRLKSSRAATRPVYSSSKKSNSSSRASFASSVEASVCSAVMTSCH